MSYSRTQHVGHSGAWTRNLWITSQLLYPLRLSYKYIIFFVLSSFLSKSLHFLSYSITLTSWESYQPELDHRRAVFHHSELSIFKCYHGIECCNQNTFSRNVCMKHRDWQWVSFFHSRYQTWINLFGLLTKYLYKTNTEVALPSFILGINRGSIHEVVAKVSRVICTFCLYFLLICFDYYLIWSGIL